MPRLSRKFKKRLKRSISYMLDEDASIMRFGYDFNSRLHYVVVNYGKELGVDDEDSEG